MAGSLSAVASSGVDVALRDGSTIHVRVASADDVEALAGLIEHLTPTERWLRFLGTSRDVIGISRRLVSAGHGLVATAGAGGEIVGHGCLVADPPDAAEVAFEVADAWQGKGIASILLAHLAAVASSRGIPTLRAWVHPSNERMLDVFRDSGLEMESYAEPEALRIELSSALSSEAWSSLAARDDRAAAAAVRHVLAPKSVAVIGASRRPDGIGATVMRKLVAAGFAGPVHPINPHAPTIAGRRAYPTIADVPEPVELAIVAVPAAAVVATARACGAAGVRALVVLTAGFREAGPEGVQRERELVAVCREAGMRLVGPNCLGVLNSAADVRLDATFAPGASSRGRIAYASQSGAFGIAALELTRRRGMGLSSFVSLGNRADLSSNDLLDYWEQDDDTDVVLLYLESLGNPRRFGRIARRVSAQKPIVAVKSGRSAAGMRAAASHTGALLEGSDGLVDALFEHAGVIRVDSLDEQLDVAALLSSQALPRGPSVAIVSNAGGPGIACADACVTAGLRVEPFAPPTHTALTRALPRAAALSNPVDLLATADPDDYRRALVAIADDETIDAVVAIYIPPLPGHQAAPIVRAMATGAARARAAGMVVASVVMPPGEAVAAGDLPVLETPEQAARALGRIVRHAGRRRSFDATSRPSDLDRDAAAATLSCALGDAPSWLEPDAVAALCAAYGIPLAPARVVDSPRAARRAAGELGGDVAVKAIVPGLVHKSDVGGVRLGLHGDAVERAAKELGDRLGTNRWLVQAMAPVGVELLVGATFDPRFGPVVVCAAGGTAAELIGDAQARLAPIGVDEADAMLRGLRTFPLLDGYRGASPADVAAVADVIARASTLVADHEAIVELDLNPVVAGVDGCVAVDGRVRVAPPATHAPYPSLQG